jgi:hypothetical protein
MASDLVLRNAKLRARLIVQARDQVDMGDYKQQLRAYQEMLLELIDIQAESLKKETK